MSQALLTELLQDRVRALHDVPDASGSFVLLWLQGQRRIRQNLAYAHAQRRANELGLPLVVYEGLRESYPHASDRFHRFVLEGVADTADECDKRGLAYAFFLERRGQPKGVLLALAERAALAVTDWLPNFIHPEQTRRFAKRARCRVEVVDAAGVAPLSAFPKQELAARTLRPKLHKLLPRLLQAIPEVRPKLQAPQRFDWGFDPLPVPRTAAALDEVVASCAIDHSVPPVASVRGGTKAGLARLRAFVMDELPGYGEGRNQPGTWKTSGMSPYLHFGHLGALEIALAAKDSGAPADDKDRFLEELLVRRELSLNFAARCPQHTEYLAAPAWARKTLEEHEQDPRPALYSDQELDEGRTSDQVWNAAQRQLREEGRIQGYLRMLWGKLLLTWSKDAKDAHRRMMWLNDKYALDGRDAVSSTNFLWILGLHDRPFPERAIYGTVRSMTSNSTRKKFDLTAYLDRWAKI